MEASLTYNFRNRHLDRKLNLFFSLHICRTISAWISIFFPPPPSRHLGPGPGAASAMKVCLLLWPSQETNQGGIREIMSTTKFSKLFEAQLILIFKMNVLEKLNLLIMVVVAQWGSIRCKHNLRWRHLSRMRNVSFLFKFFFFLQIKM